MTYIITYHPDWAPKANLKTEVEADSRDKAKEHFEKYYPRGVAKSIRKKKQ